MLRRPLNDNELEYEIQQSVKDIEQKFYEYFLDYMDSVNFDIADYQIIINPIRYIIEIRIGMKKLNMCFSKEFSLDILHEHYLLKRSFTDICEMIIHPVKEYAMSLCYKEER